MIQGNLIYEQNSLGEALSVVSQKWSFPTALPKDLLVQLNSAKHKDLTFSDRVVPAGCHNRDGLVWICAAKNGGNEPALYIKELSLNHWTLRFMMRSKHNQAKTASGIGFKEASGRISWLLTDVAWLERVSNK